MAEGRFKFYTNDGKATEGRIADVLNISDLNQHMEVHDVFPIVIVDPAEGPENGKSGNMVSANVCRAVDMVN